MPINLSRSLFPAIAWTGVLVASGALANAPVAHGVADRDATALLGLRAELAPRLPHNEFGRALVLESQEQSRQVSGDVYAVIDSDFADFRRAFTSAHTWCDVLILHANTKYCRAGIGANANLLSARFGRKVEQGPDAGFALQFAFHVDASRPGYLATRATSPTGPLGSHDYHIELKAVPLAGGKSFMRLHYSYSFGGATRLATQGYLVTGGSGKVGFTRVDAGNGKTAYVRGMRGAVERNTMRYYLAIESYLKSMHQPPGRQFSSRIRYWFDATEQYHKQLHEMDRATYLSMKQTEYARQQAVALY